ncbi:MAG: hypothetical protein H6922_05245 [Pseudomonadaceae bacterium]|nr:hypothetical protein [Pseudomonadaceae bacterium]
MFALLMFLLPALWLGYVLGYLVQLAVGALLYYRLADLTPWLISHHTALVWWSVGLAIVGNLMILTKIHYHLKTKLKWSLPLTFAGGALWITACLIKPGWIFGPFNGQVMFAFMVGLSLTAMLSYTAMLRDEIVAVFATVLMWVGAVALFHAAVLWMFPQP